MLTGGIAIKKGMIFDIKKFAIDDGPGIRTTVFLKGCPLRCWWCHNPEGQLMTPELMIRKNLCIRCDECVKNCSKEALSFHAEQLSLNRKGCSVCGNCAQKCPTGALSVVGKEMTVKEVMKEIDKDLTFYGESGGGVTFSGGEPLLQVDFLDMLLSECKRKKVHTAVDTSGYASAASFEKIRDKVDLFLYDIKIMDEKKHRKYTGVSNKLIIQNFRRLTENEGNIIVRFPVVPRINDDKHNISRLGEFVFSFGVKRIHLLPYHKAGIEKYRCLGKSYKLKTIENPTGHKLSLIRKQLEALGLSVCIGG
jgi:pyruvate formate lyase activating enzyme